MFILNFIFLSLPSSSAFTYIPNYIWNSRDLVNYETCQRTFGRIWGMDPSEESKDIPFRSDIPRLKSGWRILTWPNGRVPYVLSSRVESTDHLKRLACGMKLFHTKTCLRFVPKRRNDQNFITIDYNGGGCYSTLVGRKASGSQKINLDGYCWSHGTIIHEFMHAIGFFHEQSRDDRDQYIRVHWQNIKSSWVFQFYTSSQQGYNVRLIGKYDYGSVMHYGRFGQPTLYRGRPSMSAIRTPVYDNNNKMGSRRGATKEDIWKINKMYSCSVRHTTTRRPTRRTRRTTTRKPTRPTRRTTTRRPTRRTRRTTTRKPTRPTRRTTRRRTKRTTTRRPTTKPTTTRRTTPFLTTKRVSTATTETWSPAGPTEKCRDLLARCSDLNYECGKNPFIDSRCAKRCRLCR